MPLSSLFSPYPRASQSRVGGGRTGFLVMDGGLGIRGMAVPVAHLQKVRKTDVLPRLSLWTRGWVYSIK